MDAVSRSLWLPPWSKTCAEELDLCSARLCLCISCWPCGYAAANHRRLYPLLLLQVVSDAYSPAFLCSLSFGDNSSLLVRGGRPNAGSNTALQNLPFCKAMKAIYMIILKSCCERTNFQISACASQEISTGQRSPSDPLWALTHIWKAWDLLPYELFEPSQQESGAVCRKAPPPSWFVLQFCLSHASVFSPYLLSSDALGWVSIDFRGSTLNACDNPPSILIFTGSQITIEGGRLERKEVKSSYLDCIDSLKQVCIEPKPMGLVLAKDSDLDGNESSLESSQSMAICLLALLYQVLGFSPCSISASVCLFSFLLKKTLTLVFDMSPKFQMENRPEVCAVKGLPRPFPSLENHSIVHHLARGATMQERIISPGMAAHGRCGCQGLVVFKLS
ncbi:hypothetical protein IHE44_0001521 [Lamprotornis superbus]|uniref:Uncharacterized protein n=1 Tax=Lamprotornis superbus TaxID=245042 RepID=A0A835TVX4_9PASS|nr:hypothetical protein IHE44_0001521 [Lamprotornis superbus]